MATFTDINKATQCSGLRAAALQQGICDHRGHWRSERHQSPTHSSPFTKRELVCLLGWTWRCKRSGRLQRARPADESCQTLPLYLSFLFFFFCQGTCPGRETLDVAQQISQTCLHCNPLRTTQTCKALFGLCQVDPPLKSHPFTFPSFLVLAVSHPPLNVLVSVRTYFGALNRVRRALLLQQI